MILMCMSIYVCIYKAVYARKTHVKFYCIIYMVSDSTHVLVLQLLGVIDV